MFMIVRQIQSESRNCKSQLDTNKFVALTKTSSRSPSRIQKCRIQDFKSAISLETMDGF